LPLLNDLANPYLQFAGPASHLGAGYDLGDGFKVKVGLLNSVNPLSSQALLEESDASRAHG